jgi:predicted DsbA family dithiol-disulfide isomerase
MKFPEKERISLEHGPFQLDDSLPPEGFDKYSYLSRLIPPALLDPMIDDLCRQFRELQMEMHPRGKIGNSAPAHRLQIWAQENYPEQISTNLKDALFQIHCVQGKSMSDVDAIIGAAAKVGLKDEDQIRKVMKDKKYATKLKKMKKRAKEKLDIEAVPCLIVVQECGTARKLEEATAIETVDGFMDLVQKQCR